MAIEIVDLPINNMDIFRSKLVVYQGLTAQILFQLVVQNEARLSTTSFAESAHPLRPRSPCDQRSLVDERRTAETTPTVIKLNHDS